MLFGFPAEAGVRLSAADDALAACIAGAGLEARPGRWLDVLPRGGGQPRRLVLAVPDGDHEAERWPSLGGHLFEAMVASG